MENPEKEIADVLVLLAASTDPEVQRKAIEKYYAPDVTFRHPLCTAKDRKELLGVYQWYRIMSPEHTITVENVTFNKDKLEVFLEAIQTFRIRYSPLSPAPCRLLIHLKLRQEKSEGKTPAYVIATQEDFYNQDDLAALFVPPLAPVVRTALYTSTLVCRALAFGFSNVLGYSKVAGGDGQPENVGTEGGGESGSPGAASGQVEQKEQKEERGQVNGAQEHAAGVNGGAGGAKAGGTKARKKRAKTSPNSSYANATREGMLGKGSNLI